MSLSRIASLLGIVLLGTLLGCRSENPPNDQFDPEPDIAVPVEDLKALADGNNAFAIDLYKKVAEKHEGNLILSPYSISSALAMTYAGARGQTAEEMKKVLHFSLPQEKLHPAFSGVTNSLQTAGKKRPYQLDVANALWTQRGMGFAPGFLDTTSRCYNGSVREIDFVNKSAAIETINNWADKQTRNKVTNLLKNDDIDQSVRLVLSNAVYFKGLWKNKFKGEQTHASTFETYSGQQVPSQTMQNLDIKLKISQSGKWRLLELPYEGGRLAMIVLLPLKRCGLREIESQLEMKELQNEIDKMHELEINVLLPKFQFQSHTRLSQQLIEMGMPLAFSDADFSGIAPTALRIKDVVHGCSIDVNEDGTIAAASTHVTMKISDRPEFRVDHPFLVLIRDIKSGQIIFLARVTMP